MLEHAMLTFISRMKQRVGELLHGKTAFNLLEDQRGNHTALNQAMERRKGFLMLQRIYSDEDEVDDAAAVEPTRGGIMPLAPPEGDTSAKRGKAWTGADLKDSDSFLREAEQLSEIANFAQPLLYERSSLCTDDELMKCSCLGNSLLRVSSLLEAQLGWEQASKITAVRDLTSAIKTIRYHGLRVAKFCRLEILIQT